MSVTNFQNLQNCFTLRGVLHVREKISKILHYFTVSQVLAADNEKSFVGPIITNYLKSLGVRFYLTPSQRSEVNGQVERVHSTILEVYRCVLLEYPDLSVKELINIAVSRYNIYLYIWHERLGRILSCGARKPEQT